MNRLEIKGKNMKNIYLDVRLILSQNGVLCLLILIQCIRVSLSVGPTLKSNSRMESSNDVSTMGNVAILEELRTITDLILRSQSRGRTTINTQVIQDCTILRDAGIKASGVYKIFPFTFSVYCDMATDGGGWTVIQRRTISDVQEDFNRSWNDYKFGFGDLYTEFWIGLEALHQLTHSGLYELRIDMVDFELGPKYANYKVIRVGPEADGYRLSVSNYSGSAGDALSTFHSGRRFSTFDRDHDVSRNKSCAVEKGGGWWYHACYAAHLNGIYPDPPKRNSSSAQIRWWSDREHVLVLTSVEMKIRSYTSPSRETVQSTTADERQSKQTGDAGKIDQVNGDYNSEENDAEMNAHSKETESEGETRKPSEDQDTEENGVVFRNDEYINEDDEDVYNSTYHEGRSDVSPFGMLGLRGYE